MFSSNLPQSAYFRNTWKIPGTEWKISGHSRALERTGFFIEPLGIVLDAGVDLPTNGGGGTPKAILITHGHIDHMNALPMLLRHSRTAGDREQQQQQPSLHVFAPVSILHRIRQFAQLSWAIKVDDNQELPIGYQPPPESDRLLCLECSTGSEQSEHVRLDDPSTHRVWHGAVPNTYTQLSVGKKYKTPINIHMLQLFHGRCSSTGYLLATPATSKKKLRTDLLQGATQKETARKIKEARARGEDIHDTVQVPEIPHFAFCLDTTVEALCSSESISSSSSSSQQILSCPVVMIECTYLEDEYKAEAVNRGHVHWGGLLPFVKSSFELQQEQQQQQQQQQPKTWVLVHFSLRYKEQDILDFFQDPAECKMVTYLKDEAKAQQQQQQQMDRPPDIVLWLDEIGPTELWIDSFV